jgi:hypothetical protein
MILRSGGMCKATRLGSKGGVNTFAYVASSPMEFEDSEGLQRGVRRRSGRRDAYFVPVERYRFPDRPGFSFTTGNENQCGICYEVYYVARVEGSTRQTHRRQANDQLQRYLSGASRPSTFGGRSSRDITREMTNPTGRDMRNPSGFEWHHPTGRPNELWLMRRCDHRDPFVQPLLHPSGVGGFGRHYGQ